MKDDNIYINHILDSIKLIEEYLEGVDYDEFIEESLIQDAVIRNIEIIGEASKRLSKKYTNKHSEIPWKYICGMRDKLIHDYFGVDMDEVWKTATDDIQDLKKWLK